MELAQLLEEDLAVLCQDLELEDSGTLSIGMAQSKA